MIKKILFFLYISLYSSLIYAEVPFVDVKITDSFYNALDYLYNTKVIKDNFSHKFYPDALIKRDEFLGIVIGIGCKECINPTIEDIIKYTKSPFVDIDKNNSYFYCVSIGKDTGITEGYILDQDGKYTCQNNKTNISTPFCPENNITRIEAATILLRSAKIYNDDLNKKQEKTIRIDDIDDKWYGFAKKSIDIGLIKQDKDFKIYPNEFIDRKEFINMAMLILGINSCELKSENKNTISSGINIFDYDNINSCIGIGDVTDFSDLSINKYDFYGNIESTGSFNYYWEFENNFNGDKMTASGKCLNDFILKSNGTWNIKLIISDPKNGNSSVSYSQIGFDDTNKSHILSVNIKANPISGGTPLNVDFVSITNLKGSFNYDWNFGDSTQNSNEKNPTHIFTAPGYYVVTLKVTDNIGNIGVSQVVIEVLENADKDGDGILDKDDLCYNVYGNKLNKGCPIIDEFNGSNNGNNNGGNDGNLNNLGISNKCILDKVLQNGMINGILSCNICPCDQSIDFNSDVRQCDILFPAITSPDKNSFYSRGSVYQIK